MKGKYSCDMLKMTFVWHKSIKGFLLRYNLVCRCYLLLSVFLPQVNPFEQCMYKYKISLTSSSLGMMSSIQSKAVAISAPMVNTLSKESEHRVNTCYRRHYSTKAI